MTAAERIFEVIDEKPEIMDAPDAVRIPRIKGEIELRDVTFGYRSHEPVLKKINIKIEPGETIGLVGHSGAGKSTLINLINRFYDVDEGAIYIDGHDVRTIASLTCADRSVWSCRSPSFLPAPFGRISLMPNPMLLLKRSFGQLKLPTPTISL